MKLTHQYLSVAGLTLHYVEAMPDKQPLGTLIFLHGFPEYWGSWKRQLDYFAQDYRVIAPDLLGYNLSEKADDLAQYQVPNLVALYADFVQQLSPNEKVMLVAHDWGGAIAWPLAAFHAGLFSKLVILNAAHPSTFTREMRDNPEQRQKSAYIHQLQAKNAEHTLSKDNFAFLQAMLFSEIKGIQISEEWKQGYFEAWQQPGAVMAMCAYYKSMPQLAADDETGTGPSAQALAAIKIPQIRIDLPTLVLWGEQDKAFVTGILDGLEAYVPDCNIERFADASHWLHHEKPEAVNRAIAAFIR